MYDANDFRVLDRDGVVVGYADVRVEGDRLAVDWTSDDGAAGDVLLAWAEQRARDTGCVRVAGWAWPGSEDLADVMRSRGFAPLRASIEMHAPLDAPIQQPAWPDGFAVRNLRVGEEREVHALIEEAFADGNDFQPTPYDEWASWALANRRTDLWFAAVHDHELAGVALCDEERSGRPELAWVATLAVRRPHRRRGVGRALLLHAFAALRRDGRRSVGLSVDSENPTGAVSLYESIGMRTVSRRILFEKHLSERPAF